MRVYCLFVIYSSVRCELQTIRLFERRYLSTFRAISNLDAFVFIGAGANDPCVRPNSKPQSSGIRWSGTRCRTGRQHSCGRCSCRQWTKRNRTKSIQNRRERARETDNHCQEGKYKLAILVSTKFKKNMRDFHRTHPFFLEKRTYFEWTTLELFANAIKFTFCFFSLPRSLFRFPFWSTVRAFFRLIRILIVLFLFLLFCYTKSVSNILMVCIMTLFALLISIEYFYFRNIFHSPIQSGENRASAR